MESTIITYETINRKLINEFPELNDGYRQEMEGWGNDDPGPHIIYGNILNPYIISLLKSDGNDEKLKNIFNFIETLAGAGDTHVQEVVAFTICEDLMDDRDLFSKASIYMGKTTLRFCNEIEQFRERLHRDANSRS